MRRTRDWVGLPVIHLQKGKRVGEVSNVLFKEDTYAFALLMERGGLFLTSRAVLLADLHSMGTDAILIDDLSSIKIFEYLGIYRSLLKEDGCFVGKTMIREDGVNLGIVTDVYVADNSDKIVGYEVSDGLFADLLYGRKRVPFEATLQIGEVILVKNGVILQKT